MGWWPEWDREACGMGGWPEWDRDARPAEWEGAPKAGLGAGHNNKGFANQEEQLSVLMHRGQAHTHVHVSYTTHMPVHSLVLDDCVRDGHALLVR